MGSTYTRGQIVTDALQLAGRSQELKASCNQWLNYFLLHAGLTYRFPELRKVGAAVTLPQGSSTAPLPADFGAGMEKHGLIFGSDSKPLDEVSFEDFAVNGGFTVSGTGRPLIYMIDRQAGVFRFNLTADQSYSFIPCYYIQPPLLSVSSSDDGKSVWMDDDLLTVEGLVWFIYKYTGDEREQKQFNIVNELINQWKRELVKMGGTSRVILSPQRFKRVNPTLYGP